MAVLEQERHTHVVSDTLENFVVVSTMVSATIPAQLPHLNVFVLKINNTSDPKADALLRVARVSDLVDLTIGRDAAIALGEKEFLSPQCSLTYTDLSTAMAGATAVKDRVNQLINDWSTFQSDFNAPDPTPELITLPTLDPAQLPTLITAYTTAKQTRYTDQVAKAAADAGVTNANEELAEAQAAVTALTGFVATATSLSSEMTQAATAYINLRTAGGIFYGEAGCASGPDLASFLSALSAATSQQTVNAGYESDHAAAAAALNTYLTGTLQPALTAAQAALSAATAAQIAAAATLTAAQATEAAALAAVIAVCPDFDRTTIPLVPSD